MKKLIFYIFFFALCVMHAFAVDYPVTIHVSYPHSEYQHDSLPNPDGVMYYFSSTYNYMDTALYKDTLLAEKEVHYIKIDTLNEYHLSHSSTNKNCDATIDLETKIIGITPKGDCEVTVYFVPQVAWDMNGSGDSLHFYSHYFYDFFYEAYYDERKEVRFFYTLEDGAWYVLTALYPNFPNLLDYGSDSTYSVEPKSIPRQNDSRNPLMPSYVWIKGDGKTHYISVGLLAYDIDYHTLSIKLSKAYQYQLIVESEKSGYTDHPDTIYVLSAKEVPVTAYPYTGYVFKKWELLFTPFLCTPPYNSSSDQPNYMNIYMCENKHFLATFAPDTTIQTVLKINSLNPGDSNEVCTNVTVTAQEHEGNIPAIGDSNFTLFVDGDSTQFRLTPIGEGDSANYDLCFDKQDTIMDSDTHKIMVSTDFAGKYSNDSASWQETLWHTALKINSVKSDSLPEICTNVSMTFLENGKTITDLKNSNFTVILAGDTVQTRFSAVDKGSNASYDLCFDAIDTFMNGETHKVKVISTLSKLQSVDSSTWKEPTWKAVLKINSLDSDNRPNICTEVSVSVKELGRSTEGLKDTNFVVVQAGDTIPFTLSTVKRNKQEFYSLCVNAPVELVNGQPQQLIVNTDFAKLHAADTSTWKENIPRDADVKDSIAIFATDFITDSAITRMTSRIKLQVYTQNFMDDIYEPFKTLSVKLSCKNTGDEETITVKHQKDGFYSSSDVKKAEGETKKGDNDLTCKSTDYITAEYTDPIYKTKVYRTIKFGERTDTEYNFFDKEFSSRINSLEMFETEFGFIVTTLDPSPWNIDTITVTLFTNHRDTIRAKAVETARNSSEFRGTGRFSFALTSKEMEKDRLDAVLKDDSKNNRVVIRAGLESDSTDIRERDSLVITYKFSPADSAEILDRDGDGEADYVRVHFARSIENESIGIDTVFWGEEGDEGRGIEQSKLKKSKDNRWIEAPLNDSFGYGITFMDPDGWNYLVVARASSNATQNVPLVDKIGAVPLTAVKHPGQTTNRDIMNGEFNAPTDTLVVTLSEPLVQTAEDAWENLFYLSEDCESEEKWELYIRKPPETDDNETKWTIIIPNDIDMKAGYCLSMNPEAGYTDEAGNAPGTAGVVISGEDGGNYLYAIKASPAISGIRGNRDKWVNPETREWETIPDTISCVRTETKTSYKAEIAIYDNEGHVAATLQRHFGKNKEISNPLYENSTLSTYSGFLDWDQRTNDGRRVGTGVYIWKIRFTFKNGHKETRIIKTGIRRNR